MRWLADRLRELVNLETGTTCSHRRAPHRRALRARPRRRRSAISSSSGTAMRPSRSCGRRPPASSACPTRRWRTGDHHRVWSAPRPWSGHRAGRSAGRLPVLDIAPTLAASLGHEYTDFDGTAASRPRARHRPPVASPPGAAGRSLHRRRAPRFTAGAGAGATRCGRNVASDRLHDRSRDGAPPRHRSTVQHETAATVEALQAPRRGARARRGGDRTVSAWIRRLEVPESLLICGGDAYRATAANCCGARSRRCRRSRTGAGRC